MMIREVGRAPIVLGNNLFRDCRGFFDSIVAVVDAGLVIDTEVLCAARVRIIVLISADYIVWAVFVATIVGSDGPSIG